jgi:hypothetical protein
MREASKAVRSNCMQLPASSTKWQRGSARERRNGNPSDWRKLRKLLQWGVSSRPMVDDSSVGLKNKSTVVLFLCEIVRQSIFSPCPSFCRWRSQLPMSSIIRSWSSLWDVVEKRWTWKCSELDGLILVHAIRGRQWQISWNPPQRWR